MLGTARFAHTLRCAHLFACSLTAELMGRWIIRWLFLLFSFSVLDHSPMAPMVMTVKKKGNHNSTQQQEQQREGVNLVDVDSDCNEVFVSDDMAMSMQKLVIRDDAGRGSEARPHHLASSSTHGSVTTVETSFQMQLLPC